MYYILTFLVVGFFLVMFIKGLFSKGPDVNHKKQETPLNLDDKAVLLFRKNETSSDYDVMFYNPVAKEYWVLPRGYAYVTGEWSFSKMGDYGAYGLQKLTCSYHEIGNWKYEFRTLRDIQGYFDKMNKKHREEAIRRAKLNALPKYIN